MTTKLYLGFAIAGFAVLALLTAFREPGTPAAPVQKWDYKVIVVSRTIGDNGWTSRTEDNNQQLKAASTLDRLKVLGQEGWELVSITPISSTYHPGFENLTSVSLNKSTPSYAGFTSEVYYYLRRPQ